MKEFLSQYGIAYVEKNIRADAAARGELIAMGFNAIPVTVIGDEHISGFDRARLRRALGLTGD